MPRIRRSAEDQKLADLYGPDFLEVLARGLKVLGLFNAHRRQATLSELAEHVDLPRATVRRILYTLEKLGFVESDLRQFKLTPRVLTLASAFLSSSPLVATLQPEVARISRETNESCSAAVLEGNEVVFVARASATRVLSVGLEVGYRLPAYCTAVGRVLLGGLSDRELEVALAGMDLKKLTERTITNIKILKAQIISDRSQGYSIVDQEAELGLCSIAVPVRRYDGEVISALHIGVHSERVTKERLVEEFLPLLQAAAQKVRPMLI